MADQKLVAAVGDIDEMWGAALRERGFRCLATKDAEEAVKANADFVLIDIRDRHVKEVFQRVKNSGKASVLPLIQDSTSRNDLVELKKMGANGYVNCETPGQEVALRLQSMARSMGPQEGKSGEARSAKRVWFQQKVKFHIFNEAHEAWSTTLSETGIFIRTPLSFPLYSVLKLQFQLWGDNEIFACDGVVVRQETESEIRGLGVMFQNLKGESIRRLEEFFDIYRS